jgi:hypothetical protein
MPFAIDPVVSIMRTVPILVALVVLPLLISPSVQAAAPRDLKVLTGSLDPEEVTSFPWNLNRDVAEFVFHYSITGGTDPLDVAYVSIDEIGLRFDYLMGEGWEYCDCPLDAGAYTVTVEADEYATGPINFNIGFYLVPQPPVDFSGFIPATADMRTSSFGVIFPNEGSHTLVLGATAGSYELFVDGESQGVVTGTTNLTLDLTEDFHLFEVSSLGVSPDEDVRWTVNVQGPPKLEVRILNSCPVLNPESDQSVCVTGAEATASDGGTPTVHYLWTVTGGELNSTTSQWVEWTAPPGVASFTLTVEASAQGYTSGSDSLKVQVVPEFPSFMTPMILLLVVSLTALAQRRTRLGPSTKRGRLIP